jgi:Fic family protein
VQPAEFIESKTGKVIKEPSGYYAFVPNPLPRRLEYTPEIVEVLSEADRKIGRLDGLCGRLPNPHLLSGAYVRREAVLSSRIEGTQSTQTDLYLFELDPEEETLPLDVREVHNYVDALNYGLDRRKVLPLSLRLIRELHQHLMAGVRGKNKAPGEFRTSQNWIGGRTPADARFVPPPVAELGPALDSFEKFLYRDHPQEIPPLIECALIHYQFETIHPFLDGNGRVGRLLLTLLAIERGCLAHPLLYLSAFFENNREEYYDHLYQLSQSGDWMPWFEFFLKGVAEQADDAIWRAGRVFEVFDSYTQHDLKPSARRLLDVLLTNPIVSLKFVSEKTDVTLATASSAVSQLVSLGILSPLTENRKRGQNFVASALLETFTSEIHSPTIPPLS